MSSALSSRTSLKRMQLSPISPLGFALPSIPNPSCSGTSCTGQVLRTVFPGRRISRFSSDIAVTDYFLWGYVKSKVYETRPVNIDYLKRRILECIQRISKEMLKRVITAFPLRLQECTERHGGHLQSVIIRQ